MPNCPYCGKPLIYNNPVPFQVTINGVIWEDGFICDQKPYCKGLYPGDVGEKIWKNNQKVIFDI